MTKITVIVPVYNVRDYLEKCIRSVQQQTLTDWELILVNDGSTDGSDKICREQAGQDPRIRVIDQPNGGVSAARNAGLEAASGEYVTFLDGDDAYETMHLEMLLALAEREHADVVATGARHIDLDGSVWGETSPVPGTFHGKEEILRQFFLHSERLYGCWNKLFKRAVIGELRFQPYILAEDALFCTEVLACCGVYAVSDACTYRYLRRPDSVTMRGIGPKTMDQIKAWRIIYDLLDRNAPELCSFAAGKICHDVDKYYMPCYEGKAGNWRECCAYLKESHIKFFLRQFSDGQLSMRKRAADIIYKINPVLYYRLAGGHRRSEAR